MHPDDTIVAQASAAGPGARAIVRLSGPRMRTCLSRVFKPHNGWPLSRCRLVGAVQLPEFAAPIPAEVLYFPGPNSYTGQDVAEIHLLSSPPIIERLIAALLSAGARAARPGEFTLRRFLAGKLDLPRAEAVLAVIEAGDDDQLRAALSQLAGNVTRPLDGLRDDLLNLLADVEAGLDFADEDISFVHREDLLIRLSKGMAQVTNLRRQLHDRARSDRPFRAALVGRPNAGKSRLFNRLTGGKAIVSSQPGTTRDYLIGRLEIDGVLAEVIDTAGRQSPRDAVDAAAQSLGRTAAGDADLLLVLIPAGEDPSEEDRSMLAAGAVAVASQCDRAPGPDGWLATSAVTGAGLDDLRRFLAERARARREPPLAPSLSRCRHHVDKCLEHLRNSHSAVLFDDPAEILALELRAALEQLGELVGAVYTDDLLDRIFSRFCIGK